MKKYSIGYKDSYGHFGKVWESGSARKFTTIEECEEYINQIPKENYKYIYNENGKYIFKIMQGWNVITIITKEEMN